MKRARRGGWTPERLQQLSDLWAQGLSITAIGRRLEKTRNAVVGMAHRINLAPRVSPILVYRERRRLAEYRQGLLTQIHSFLVVEQARREAIKQEEERQERRRTARKLRLERRLDAARKAAEARRQELGYPIPEPSPGTCHWPVGTPGTRDFHWCGKKQLFRRRFCQDHEVKFYLAEKFGEKVPVYQGPTVDEKDEKEERTRRSPLLTVA
jgi:GcrA cell cycle regulator